MPLRSLSSSFSSALSMADLIDAAGDATTASSNNDSGHSIASADMLSLCHSSGAAVRPSDSITDLGTTTQSLLRTMRLDVVLLGSREEEMRNALVELESHWEMLEQLLEEQRRTEALEESAKEADDDADEDGSRQKGDDDRNAKYAPQGTSTIDWDGAADGEVKKKEIKKKIPIQKEAPEQVASQLKNSNFDWGADGETRGSILEEAKRASMLSSSGETVSRVINGKDLIAEAERRAEEQNEVPILRRMFQPRERPKKEDGPLNNKPNEMGGGNRQDGGRCSELSTSTAASFNSKNSQERRGWWGRNNSRKCGRIEDDQSENSSVRRGWWGRSDHSVDSDKNKTLAEDKSISTVGSMSVNERPPTFRLFGGRSKRQMQNNVDSAASINTRDTVETQQTRHSSDTSSSHQAGATRNSNNSQTSPLEDSRAISALQVKLRGCDSAASTLEQLLSYQTRNLLDLRYERNSLQSSLKFDASQSEAELEKLRTQLHFAKVERRRKARFVEEAQKKMKKTQHQEELLKGELESIRTELFLLNMERTKAQAVAGSRGGGGNGGCADSNNGGGGGDIPLRLCV